MRFLIALIFLCGTLPNYAQVPSSSEFDAVLKKAVQTDAGPGLTIGVVHHGKLIYQNHRGLMNLEYGLPYNDSTVFGLASVTKQFTAACIGILEKQGQLSVQDDVRKHLPELAFYGDTIRIQHLLSHTSGIRNHNVLLDLQGFDYAHRGYTNRMIEELMFRQAGVNNRPGEKMLYSNTNYVLLALIVERASGKSLPEFAQEYIFEPLGMQQSFYRRDLQEIISNRAVGYYRKGPHFQRPASVTLCIGAGGMGSSIADLARWSNIFLDPEHPFAWLGDFITHTENLSNGQAMKHARGMFVAPYRGINTYNHSGRDRAMRSQFLCVPELELAIVVYANTSSINAVEVSYSILDLFLGTEDSEDEEMARYAHTKKSLQAFGGDFQELNSDLRMHFFVENDSLKVKASIGRMAVPLRAVGAKDFVRADNPSVKYSFLQDDASGANLWIDFGGAIFYFERVELNPHPDQNLGAFAGDYYSAELDVNYSLKVEDGKLVLNYPMNSGIVLHEGQKDCFGSNRRTKYSFQRDQSGQVKGFSVAAEGTVRDILFLRVQ